MPEDIARYDLIAIFGFNANTEIDPFYTPPTPYAQIDYQTRIMVTNDIYDILRKEKITVLMVTHDISEAISMSDRVIVLSKRPGTIKEIHKIKFS